MYGRVRRQDLPGSDPSDGTVRAMEFDFNTEWVSFMTYDSIRDPINPPATKLLPEFRRNGGRYFNTDERDFVAVCSR